MQVHVLWYGKLITITLRADPVETHRGSRVERGVVIPARGTAPDEWAVELWATHPPHVGGWDWIAEARGVLGRGKLHGRGETAQAALDDLAKKVDGIQSWLDYLKGKG